MHHFAELLMTSGVVLNDDVHWITFHRFGLGVWFGLTFIILSSNILGFLLLVDTTLDI